MIDNITPHKLNDLFEAIVRKCPPNQIQELQLVSSAWKRRIASPFFGNIILRKPTLLLVSPESFYVIHLSLFHPDKGNTVVYVKRSFTGIRFPIRKLTGSCNGLTLVKDNANDLHVVNPRNMEQRKIQNFIIKAYAIGNISAKCSIVRVDDLFKRVTVMNLQKGKWEQSDIYYSKVGWKLDSITQQDGVFIGQRFIWVGRITRDGAISNALITYDGERNVFDHVDIPGPLLQQIPVAMKQLSENTIGLFTGSNTRSVWVMKFTALKYESRRINLHMRGYDPYMEVEPLAFIDHTENLLLLKIYRKQLYLYDVQMRQRVKKFLEVPDTDELHSNVHATWLQDTYALPH